MYNTQLCFEWTLPNAGATLHYASRRNLANEYMALNLKEERAYPPPPLSAMLGASRRRPNCDPFCVFLGVGGWPYNSSSCTHTYNSTPSRNVKNHFDQIQEKAVFIFLG